MPRREQQQVTNHRAKHHKSRKACLTCRQRRIRCDESYPACKNCESTGRTCDGVSTTQFTFVNPTKPRTRTPSPQSQLPAVHHPEDERRSFNFFIVNVAPVFATGSVDSTFWSKFIPQLSSLHPTIWDAVISIALLYEFPVRPKDPSTDQVDHNVSPQQLKALKWYSRSVSRFAHGKDLLPNDEISALLTCVLFAALEFQQGSMQQATDLIEKGTELIFSYLQSTSSQLKSPESKAMAEIVVPFFSRHAVFMATLGMPLMSGWPSANKLDAKAESQQAALQSLDSLMVQLHSIIYRGHHFIWGTGLILHDEEEKRRVGMFEKQQALLQELKEWHERFSTVEDRQKPENAWIAINLTMYYLVTHTWVSTCLSHTQTAFDAYPEVFEEIIYHASSIMPNIPASPASEQSQSRATSSFGAGCIPPLYFTAIKCRDPITRRWALDIIRRMDKGNSIWARIPTVAILEAIIAFEEDTRDFIPVPESQLPPPDHHRVHHVQLLPDIKSIRLFTYPEGHPSDPKYLQVHDVPLKDSTAMPSGSQPFQDNSATIPNGVGHATMGDLWGNLTISDPSPSATSWSTSPSEIVTPCQTPLDNAHMPVNSASSRLVQ